MKLLNKINNTELTVHLLIWGLYFSSVNADWHLSWFDETVRHNIPSPLTILSFPITFYLNAFFLIPNYLQKRNWIIYGITFFIFAMSFELLRASLYAINMYSLSEFSKVYNSILFGKDSLIFGRLNPIWYGFVFSTLYRLLRDWFLNNQKIAQLEKDRSEAQLNVLKSQINPHFLFNNFNTLDALIDEDPVKAKIFLSNLSNIYRYTIQYSEKTTAPLQSEIDYINDYINLTKIRFGDAYRFFININDITLEGFEIAPLSLQILVENAMKHNKANIKTPLIISINIHDNKISITNIKRPKTSVPDSLGTGLKNLISRYQILTKTPIEFNETEEEFTVILPFLEINR